jgi:predicted Zn-dependent protease
MPSTPTKSTPANSESQAPASDDKSLLLTALRSGHVSDGQETEIVARNLDKDSEYEADRIGMVLAARAGCDPYTLPRVLEEFSHARLLNRGSSTPLFKTPPCPTTVSIACPRPQTTL